MDPSGIDTTTPARPKGVGRSFVRMRLHSHNRDTIKGITKPAIKRLARRGGVRRLNFEVYEEVRSTLKSFLQGLIGDAVTLVMSRSRVCTGEILHPTVCVTDVIYATPAPLALVCAVLVFA